MDRRAGIDIIVPVYNALDDLKLCVESIKRHTDLALDRVIFIDDRSPDQNVFTYLKSIEAPGMIVLQNEQNQGFSGTINRGISYSDRDVLLLNTDTIVTARWIDKITACAYSDAAIATVTPFSNNATLCSIPNFCEENTIPYGLSIDEYAQVIEHSSMKKYPRISVAVGFCMFIKREVIDQTGLFDKETFQRGYGEENDFCWRAEQLGYYHVLCDDTYIYHSGTVSFLSEEKKKLIAEHEQILQDRYPKQNHANAVYVRDNPHQYLRNNVDIYAKLKNGKKNILYVLHMDFRTDAQNNIGGTQFHVKDLMLNLRQENNVFVLARDGEYMRLTIYLTNEQITFKFHVGKPRDFQPFHSEQIAKVFRDVMTAFAIDVVHVHHVSGLSFDVFPIAKELGIPLVLSLHDYYYICPTVKLLKNGKMYCGGCSENCVACMHKELGYAEQVSYLPVWREHCRKALESCDILITPSQAAKDIYASIYPEIAERIRVIFHGMDTFEEVLPAAPVAVSGFMSHIESAFENGYCISGWAIQENVESRDSEVLVRVEDSQGKNGIFHALSVNRPDLAESKGNDKYLSGGFSVQIPDAYFASGVLKIQIILRNNGKQYYGPIVEVSGYIKNEKTRKRIAFLGGLNEAKGSQIAYHMIKQAGNKYDWYIVGGIGDPDLITLDKSNVHKTGWYKRENVGRILSQNLIDMVCILPIWPETFCYTVSEAELAGVPVLASDIGALGERIRKDQTGWLVKPDATVKDILKTIDNIFADEAQFAKISENAARFTHRSIADMCHDYEEVYCGLPTSAKKNSTYDAQAIYAAYTICQTDVPAFAADNNAELVQRINELEATLNSITQSVEYRMLKFFNRESIPFKRQIKWMIGVAYRVYMKFFKK